MDERKITDEELKKVLDAFFVLGYVHERIDDRCETYLGYCKEVPCVMMFEDKSLFTFEWWPNFGNDEEIVIRAYICGVMAAILPQMEDQSKGKGLLWFELKCNRKNYVYQSKNANCE